MTRCGWCNNRFSTLDDEEGMHACPRCGWAGTCKRCNAPQFEYMGELLCECNAPDLTEE